MKLNRKNPTSKSQGGIYSIILSKSQITITTMKGRCGQIDRTIEHSYLYLMMRLPSMGPNFLPRYVTPMCFYLFQGTQIEKHNRCPERERERDHSNKKELDAQKTKGNKDKVIVAQKQMMET